MSAPRKLLCIDCKTNLVQRYVERKKGDRARLRPPFGELILATLDMFRLYGTPPPRLGESK